jgi:hypothetical protein
MISSAEFEAAFLGALQQLRSELQGLQCAVEAQLSAWLEHLFRDYLGYSWNDFTRGEGVRFGAKGGKQLFPDLRINILDTGLIFVECKRPGLLDGLKGPDELNDGVGQVQGHIRAHLDRASIKPKTVLGVVTDGNRWSLLGLNRVNQFHTIAEWAFLTDDPRLIAQRLWLLAKPALAQPTSPLVEFLARRTLAEVLKESTRSLTKKVNEKLPDGAVSEELIGKWLRDAFSDPAAPSRLVAAEPSLPAPPELLPANAAQPGMPQPEAAVEEPEAIPAVKKPKRYSLRKRFWEGVLARAKAMNTRHANIAPGEWNCLGASSGIRGLNFNYCIGKAAGKVELYIDRGADGAEENKSIFDRLHKQKDEIERAFGGALSFERLDDKRACRIAHIMRAGGWRSAESQWPNIQDTMFEAMARLEKAFEPHLAKLKAEV